MAFNLHIMSLLFSLAAFGCNKKKKKKKERGKKITHFLLRGPRRIKH